MVKQFLKMGGVKTEKEFYNKYPTEESFFQAHPEALHMAYGGINAYGPGGPILPGTMSKAIAAFQESEKQPPADSSGVTDFIRRPTEEVSSFFNPSTAPVSAPHVTLNPYQGVSVYDFLQAQGKAGDYQSRKGLAKTLGISGYTGTPGQNAQMMEMIRQNPDILESYTGASIPVSPSTSSGRKRGPKKEEFTDADYAAYNDAQAASNPFITGVGLPNSPKAFKDYLPQLGRGTSEKDRRIIERQNAKDFNEHKTDTFTLPNGKTKRYDQMTWKEKAYVAGKSLEGKGRFNENDEAWYDKINPLAWVTGAAGALGEAPLKAQMSGSIKPIVSAVAAPIAAGAGAGYLNYFRPTYEPYNPNQLPGAGPVAGQRALPPSQRALPPSTPRGWTMAEGAYRSPNYPFHREGGMHGNPGVYADGYSGTYSNGSYFQGGGSYNPTSVNYGDMLPQFAMGYNIPEAMYGMGMAEGGTPCYNCGGMYEDGGSPLYSTQGQTLRNFTNTLGYTEGGWNPSHITLPNVGPRDHEYVSRTPANLPNLGRGLTIPRKFNNGGLVKGSVHDMSEAEIQELINQGYKIEYI
jgi:hypothetical protein